MTSNARRQRATNSDKHLRYRGSNEEHESKRARRDYESRVHTVSPRLPLNRSAWSLVRITFDESDFQVRDFPHSDAFIATANVADFTLHNILIDTGSSADILFIKAFESMGLDKCTLEPAGKSLFGFGSKKIDAIGKKAIPVSFEEGKRVRTETIMFDIVNMDYPSLQEKMVLMTEYVVVKSPNVVAKSY
ncbi:unnamed protein product [Miscanthus lutarioriparius]|uniref:Peptidase A2 domain-containing protein n=1 Tax=Miscanthus lutarioriparius TaxID=422564 RepID=A0A811QJ33_9POAL|nr:unnamed protein product [Miscanthus lutarioriparius]